MRLRDLLRVGNFSGKSWESVLEKAGLILLLIYFLAGVIYSALLSPAVRYVDEQEYLNLSYNLIHGPGYSLDGVHLTAGRPPGYAFFLSSIRIFGGDIFSIRVAQFILVCVTIFLVSRLGSERKFHASLFLATGLVICYPVLFYTSATLYPQILAGFLFMLALTFMLAGTENALLSLFAGLAFGALILDVPTFLFTFVVVLGTAHFLKLVRWRNVLLISLAATLTVGTWTLRNAICFHRFVPVASNSGVNLLIGNNPRATACNAIGTAGAQPYGRQISGLELDEFQTDDYYRNAALTWIKEHPGQAIILYLEKVLNFFNIVNVYENDNREEISAWKQVVMAISYLLLLALLGWRLVDFKRFPLSPREKLFLIVYVLSAFTTAIFFTRIRLRLPFDFLIITVIAFNLSRRMEVWICGKNVTETSPTLPIKAANLG